jgi:taurine dioxygenase
MDSAALPYSRIAVSPFNGALGAEIAGVDLAQPIAAETFAEIRRALADYGVVVFRDQSLTPEQHLAFAQRWGEINVNRFFHAVEGYPAVAEVRKEAHQKSNIGNTWHTDHSYDQVPALGSLLYALEVPPYGGDTLFASMALAYDSLSDGLKATLAPLKAWHSSRHVFGEETYRGFTDAEGRLGNAAAATQDALHPIVVTHPESRRKVLYVNPQFTVRIDGWTEEESKALLGYLYQHAVRPEFTCRLRWSKGALAIWDNRATWHYATNDYQGHRRLMHRVTVEGVALS